MSKQINFKLGPEYRYGHLDTREKGIPGRRNYIIKRKKKRKFFNTSVKISQDQKGQ